ncbi:lipoprotein [Kitasatospora phosalacinea]|uniref:Lipoprotein n=1 Tax=Kitasatospora phosalacinea TaxID=2065 RepID=A0A9W6QCG2_9ACTN|nr:SurA N-terminal domain-containing protein [Kitasatospora phosalacinea]GLW74580.1 lipoprotein [Kitasatospora phosalacinea]
MIRTSSARRLRAALGTAVAAAALAACSGAPAHQGAAAVVGSDRISIAQVEARVTAVRDGAARSGAATEEQPGLARHAVSDLILGKVVARALADRGLTVSQGEIDRARAADARTVGSEAKLAELLRAKQGVPATDVDGFYRQQIGLVKLADGQDPSSAEGDAAIRKALVDAGAALHIEVNPRYGSWNTAGIGLEDSTENWLPASGRAAL